MAVVAGHALVVREIGCPPSGERPIVTPIYYVHGAVLVVAGRRMTERDAVDVGSAVVAVCAIMRVVPVTTRAAFMSVSAISTSPVRPVCTISLLDGGTSVSNCLASYPTRMHLVASSLYTPKEASQAPAVRASVNAVVTPNAREGNKVPVLGRTGLAVAVKV